MQILFNETLTSFYKPILCNNFLKQILDFSEMVLLSQSKFPSIFLRQEEFAHKSTVCHLEVLLVCVILFLAVHTDNIVTYLLLVNGIDHIIKN